MSDSSQSQDHINNKIIERIQKAHPDALQATIRFRGELTLVIDRAALTDVCAFLRDEPDLGFNYMCDLSAVDLWPENPRFEVNVHLLAMPLNPEPGQGARRMRIKVKLEESDATLPTLTGVWPSTAWYERETHELFGIGFSGNPDLRPLLLPDDWEGVPPMRRDVPVLVEEVAFSFNQERIYREKPFAKE
jgi:NADH-quinone oxidoreductase subunit C